MSGTEPAPQGNYLAARRHRDLIFTSGMTPRQDGVLTLTGPVRKDEPLDTYRDAVVLATRNALAAARARLGEGEAISSILSLTVYIAAEPGFTAHSRIADFASAFLASELRSDGIGSRAAVGVATLPGDAPVEVQLVAGI